MAEEKAYRLYLSKSKAGHWTGTARMKDGGALVAIIDKQPTKEEARRRVIAKADDYLALQKERFYVLY